MEVKDEDKRLHLQLVENVITRMNSNSFQIKTWTITIFSAFLALAASTKSCMYICFALFPTIIFWRLDAYYLQQERKFRRLYEDIIAGKKVCYSMNINDYYDEKCTYKRSFWSLSMQKFYVSVIVCILILSVVCIAKWFIEGGGLTCIERLI